MHLKHSLSNRAPVVERVDSAIQLLNNWGLMIICVVGFFIGGLHCTTITGYRLV